MQTPLSSRLAYQGRIFDVTVDRVQLPHGPLVDLEIVRHDGSVVLLPVADDGRVLLVRQYRYAAGRYLWEARRQPGNRRRPRRRRRQGVPGGTGRDRRTPGAGMSFL